MDTTVIKDSLDRMYKLGYEHGYEAAKRDIQIQKLEEEIKRLEQE